MRAFLMALAVAVTGALSAPEFALYDLQSAPGGGWTAMSAADFNQYKPQFVDSYNANGGLGVVKPFRTGNCCIAVKGGKMLTITGTKYGFQFPADAATGEVKCNPAEGYTGKVQLFLSPKLSAQQSFAEEAKCKLHHNPAVYMRLPRAPAAVEFGVHDFEAAPAGGWVLMGAADFESHRDDFLAQYNDGGGLSTISNFKSGNCCFAVKGGDKLVVSGTPYKWQFPASAAGGIRCNPTAGYGGMKLRFYRTDRLVENMEFSARPACETSHNPGIFIRALYPSTRRPTDAPTPAPTKPRSECIVTAWGAWGDCSTSCGQGTYWRHRTIEHVGENGAACPHLKETHKCFKQECPVHCEIGEFGTWSACNQDCGGGQMTRTRPIVQEPTSTGSACPHLRETAECNTAPCKVHCKVSSFSEWDACTNDCGGGTQARTRTIVTDASFDGSPCPKLREERVCNSHKCTDCVVAAWGAFGGCSMTCGAGTATRTRTVVAAAKVGGKPCPALGDTKSCSSGKCPTACEVMPWGPWSACSKTCGVGTEARSRKVLEHARAGGFVCPALSETRECETQACAVDCVLSAWSVFGACSKTCGTGTYTRARSVLAAARDGGTCKKVSDTQPCDAGACTPADRIEFALYDMQAHPSSGWTLMTLADINKHKSALVQSYNANGGFNLLKVFKSGNCAIAVPGENQKLTVSGTAFGFVFPSADGTKVECNPKNGYMAPKYTMYKVPTLSAQQTFGSEAKYTTNHNPALFMRMPQQQHIEFGLADATTSPGLGWQLMTVSDINRHKSAFIAHFNSNGGINPISTFQSGNCCIAVKGGLKLTISGTKHGFAIPSDPLSGAARCNPVGGYTAKTPFKFVGVRTLLMSQSFSEATACADSHNPGIFMRLPESMSNVEFGIHDFARSPAGGWQLMSAADFTHHAEAFIAQYNANSGVSLISTFQGGNCCFAVSGGDKLVISGTPYKWQFPASTSGGIRCNPTSGYNEPTYQFYRVPQLADDATFSQMPACATNHNPGIYMRGMRATTVPPTPAPTPEETQDSIDCKVSPWSKWGDCSQTCGTGTHSRTRTVLVLGSNGMVMCPPLKETQSCSVQDCPVHCKVGHFGAWSKCTVACGGGSMHRVRKVMQTPTTSGSKCPHLSETTDCNIYACPVHCAMSAFSGWSGCSKSCGSGTMLRRRAILVDADFNGTPCKHTEESKTCNEDACAADCVVASWGAWSDCTLTCGSGGVQKRTRWIKTHQDHGGNACPTTKEQRACAERPCPINCEVSVWTFSACSVTCGTGQRTQSRSVLVKPQHGGRACDAPLERTLGCSAGDCPTHCEVSAWGTWSACSRSCGLGSKMRKRAITSHASNGGYTCPELQDTGSCELAICGSDCRVSDWTDWSSCTATCGVGSMQVRTRTITAMPHDGGHTCPSLHEMRICDSPACPVHCSQSEWTEWTSCTQKCGGGVQTRTRTTHSQAAYGGTPCASPHESMPCNEAPCPIDCIVGEWSYGSCSVTCGTGSRTRSRTAIRAARFGGKSCPEVHTSYDCNAGPCAVHCEVSAWSAWTPCSATCGDGTQSKTRAVVKHSEHGGYTCPSLDHERPCNSGGCPVDCAVSAWSAWARCSKTCGGGLQKRGRSVVVLQQFEGKSCPALEQTADCGNQGCPLDCKVSAFTPWTPCSKTCGGDGTQTRDRSVAYAADRGGRNCPALHESRACSVSPCAVDCKVGPWGAWTAVCSKTCGGGTVTRSRDVVQPGAFGGVECPPTVDMKGCNPNSCPVDCKVSNWSHYSACSKSCVSSASPTVNDIGSQKRTRTVVHSARYGGKDCGALAEKRECNTHLCPTGCVMSAWSVFGACSSTCGAGTQKRVRQVAESAHHGGIACPSTEEMRACDSGPCPLHCTVSIWKEWSPCTKDCGLGMQERYRSVTQHAEVGGFTCPSLLDTRECMLQPCKEDCVVGSWGSFGACTKSCGRGIASRFRKITREAAEGGEDCPILVHTKTCNETPCAVDCTVSPWEAFGECSSSCGSGTQSRSRAVFMLAIYGGRDCAALTEERACSQGPCPKHCTVNPWGAWGACSTTCGVGIRSRSRTIYTHPQFGGYTCPSLSSVGECQVTMCPLDCLLSDWGPWATCSATCGAGTQNRHRHIAHHEEYGGKSCPPSRMTESRSCVEDFCPVHCEVSDWAPWQACSLTCGSGIQRRFREVTTQPQFGGLPCPLLTDVQTCNGASCPFDCTVSDWGAFGACSVSCGKGSKTRARKVEESAYAGGKICPTLTDTAECDVGACPVHCETSSWSAWSVCPRSCGIGMQFRTRTITEHAANGGYVCPAMRMTRECLKVECAVNCKVTEWSNWSMCSRSCDGGIQSRKRSVAHFNKHGGAACPTLSEQQVCSTQECPVNCEVGPFGPLSACDKTCGASKQMRTRVVKTAAKYGGRKCLPLFEDKLCDVPDCMAAPMNFGLYDADGSPGPEWHLMSEAEIAQHRQLFIKEYNEKGLQTIKTFRSGNCCISVAGGKKLVISGTKYGYQFPAGGGSVQCNPKAGYVGTYEFYMAPKLDASQVFSSKEACKTSHNPGLFIRNDLASLEVPEGPQFGLYDYEVSPGVGWTLMTTSDFTTHREQFVKQYNVNHGVAVIKPFQSGNCCIAVKGGNKIVISGTKYGWQFPATSGTGGVRCNPAGGYTDRFYEFYTAPTLGADIKFSEKAACATSHNPGIYIRGHIVPTPSPTQPPTPPPTPAPVHCRVTSWEAWGECSTTCGPGVQWRKRSVIAMSQHGGKECPKLMEQQGCTAQDCPVHCRVSPFLGWGKCDRKCGGGLMTRSRSIIRAPVYNGNRCPHLSETAECNTAHCPVHCKLSSFSAWTPCSRTCGVGFNSRTRSILTTAKFDGTACAVLKQEQTCNDMDCPSAVDCIVSIYNVGACSSSCGSGTATHHREVLRNPMYGGRACPALQLTNGCDKGPCPVHCEVSEWSALSSCSTTCGAGTQMKTRRVTQHANYGGFVCPSLVEKVDCNIVPCAVDCALGLWGEWGECSKSCGTGTHTRTRSIVTAAKHGGKCEPSESKSCMPGPCTETGAPKGTKFAIGDLESHPGSGWELMAIEDVQMYKSDIVAAYNADGGFKVIKAFMSGNCAIAVKGGDKLKISGTKFGFLFPESEGKVVCNPKAGYTKPMYQLLKIEKLSVDQTFTAKAAYTTQHNPALYMQLPDATISGVVPTVEFGLYDAEVTPPGGWNLMHIEDLEKYKAELVLHYNTNGGLNVIRKFHSGNCCLAVAGGLKLSISGTKHGMQFPADPATGKVSCSPTDGYTGKYSLYTVQGLSVAQTFTAKTGCATSHNPGIYMRLPETVSTLEFGIYDYEKMPSGGWTLLSAADFNTHHTEFITQYNAGNGINVIEPFQSGNCCFAVKGGEKLIVSGTPYKWQFPASSNGGIRCNPTGGYTEGRYQFYRTPVLDHSMHFAQKAACSTSHNPGIFMRGFRPKTNYPTPVPTPAPTPLELKPADCRVAMWAGWGACSKTCDRGGVQHRTRAVIRVAFNGGEECPALKEEQECFIQDCAIDCQTGVWGEWGECTSQCAGGSMTRSRTVLTPPNHNGDKCPHLSETASCNTHPCPVHCSVSSFTGWSACSVTCGSGVQARAREVLVDVQFEGTACPGLRETQSCDAGHCPLDCEVTSWEDWSACPQTCENGSGLPQVRHRSVSQEAQHGGKKCPTIIEQRMCATHACPIDCVMDSWGPYGECSVTCGAGTHRRMRGIDVEMAHGGKACLSRTGSQACDAGPCPVNCEVSSWSAYLPCSVTCGVGVHVRSRTVTQHADHGGYTCPALFETMQCEEAPCPVSCTVSTWGTFGECSKTCGRGEKTRTRRILSPAKHGGYCDMHKTDTQKCHVRPCPIDCIMHRWSTWGACDLTCGSGWRPRTRGVSIQPKYGGKICSSTVEKKACMERECPVHCEVSSWGSFGTCTKSCGTDGAHTRTRSITVQPQFLVPIANAAAAAAAAAMTLDERLMNAAEFATKFADIADRSATEQMGDCPPLSETKTCDNVPSKCPRDCQVSSWGAWTGLCSKTCGGGRRTRTRTMEAPAADGGAGCGSLVDVNVCNSKPCPVDCKVSSWGAFSACSGTCGVGKKYRSRTFVAPMMFGGNACPSLSDEWECTGPACPVHCAVSSWSEWGACSATCGKGVQMRSRTVVSHAENGGYVCPALSDTQECLVLVNKVPVPCPADCIVSEWSNWSACSTTCGAGLRRRSRSPVVESAHGGMVCPTLEQTMPCPMKKQCPVDCRVSSWEPWSSCSQSCGGGKQTRIRRVIEAPSHGGQPCLASLTQMADCNTPMCPMDACKVTSWGSWSSCSATCNGGEHSRTRAFLNPEEVDVNGNHRVHGVKCPALAERKPCMAFTCPTISFQDALAAAKATIQMPKRTDSDAGAKFDADGRLKDHKRLVYFPKLSTSCCRASCRGKKDCELGCSLWLHSSSLNWASAAWHPQLLKRCERDCSSSKNHAGAEGGTHRLLTDPQYGVRKHDTMSYWTEHTAKLTPADKAECQHGCKYYLVCLGVSPI